jgi:hypothetical protein
VEEQLYSLCVSLFSSNMDCTVSIVVFSRKVCVVLEQHTQGLAGSKNGSVVQSSRSRIAEYRVHVTAAACAEQAHDMTAVTLAIVTELIEPFKKAPRF